jgi:hypothetical protein
VAPPPEVVFGDWYLAWNQTGLYLATISMDHYDYGLLAYGDTFPLEEAFRLEWGVDAGAGPQRFALYFIPPKEAPTQDAPAMRAQLCRTDAVACESVPTAIVSSFGSDPRIIAEVWLPWSALGVSGPPPDRRLRVELATTSFHRARWMSWSGLPPAVGIRDATHWRTVQLGGELPPAQP